MKESLILIGGGGHCRSCIDVIETAGHYAVGGIVDLPENVGSQVYEYPVVASDSELSKVLAETPHFHVTLGGIHNLSQRAGLFQAGCEQGGTPQTLVSPHAHISEHATVGKGSAIMHYALINASAAIADNVIINTRALIEHDAKIGSHSHISTAAVINGGTVVGERTFIGSGAVLRDNITIGNDVFIACGVRVLEDVPDGEVLKS